MTPLPSEFSTPDSRPSGRKRGRPGALPLLFAFLALAMPAAAQQTGRIAGRVTDATSGAPLGEVQVYLPGTGLGTLTRATGQFLILNAPVGVHELRAERIGLGTVSRQITVAAGQAVEANLTMSAQALGLDEIVVTGAAGASRRREIGNSITQIRADNLAGRPASVANLLQASAPGLDINAQGGELGAAQKIRIRGNNSITQGNNPIIYVDGVRIRSEPLKKVEGVDHPNHSTNRQLSPLEGINPNDIERVEVISGPAATTLYGTDAGNGVIQIFTKKGMAGAPTWTLETQQGAVWGRKFGTDLVPYYRLDPWLKTGHTQRYSVSVRGGGEDLQYLLSGQKTDDEGIVPNEYMKVWSGRGNFTFTPAQNLQIQSNNNWVNQWNKAISTSNAMGLGHNVYRGDANYLSNGSYDAVKVILDYDFQDRVDRGTTGGTITYSPLADFTNRLTIGYDFTNMEQRSIRPFGFPLLPEGALLNHTWQNRLLNFDYVGTYRFDVTSSLRSSFSWGGQAVGDEDRTLRLWGMDFPGAGEPTITSAAIKTSWEERQKVWNAGFFAQNVFDVANRYFITLGMRVDGNSAFGSGFGLQMYPKASLTWVTSDEGFWNPSWGQVKVRSAYGRAGRAPGAFDATRTWTAAGHRGQPAFIPGTLGDPDLGPEITSELEVGADASWMDNRIRSTFTYYNQKTDEALLMVAQVPSNGFQNSQLRNVGKIQNAGTEFTLGVSVLQGENLGWDLGGNVTTNHNEVLDLGGVKQIGTNIIVGQPVPVMTGRYIRNGDKVALTILACTAAAAVADPTIPCIEQNHVYGPNTPTLTWSLNSDLRVPFGIRLSAMGEFKGGGYTTVGIVPGMVSRGGGAPECFPYYTDLKPLGPPPLYIGGTGGVPSLKPETPAIWRARCHPQLSNNGYFILPSDFFRLRNLSASIPVDFLVPERIRGAELTLALNNSWTWLNKEWLTFDPDMKRSEGLEDSFSNDVPPPIAFRASLRFNF
ncbi:MAG: hypothetical protein EXR95_07220 [Gemmatimonadetes bacterium]|nr:hypothetical protein [Gemmatimonadota bacterium]